jgi:hypothetical protein
VSDKDENEQEPEKFEIAQVIKTYTDKVVKDISGNVY